MPPSLIIFDMDDTLVATASLWKEAESRLLNALGAFWTVELASLYKGMNALDVAAVIHTAVAPEVSLAECQKRLRAALLELFEKAPPAFMPGAEECVHQLAEIAPLALASGSPYVLIKSTIERLGLSEKFSILLSSESVSRGKPFPDVFLATAQAHQTPPERCLVLEDSLVGVQAAKAAGMRCFAVPSSCHEEVRALADETFPSLHLVERAISKMKR